MFCVKLDHKKAFLVNNYYDYIDNRKLAGNLERFHQQGDSPDYNKKVVMIHNSYLGLHSFSYQSYTMIILDLLS